MDTIDRGPLLRGIVSQMIALHLPKCNEFPELPPIQQDFFPLGVPSSQVEIYDINITDHLHPLWHFWAHLLTPPTNPSLAILQGLKKLSCFSDTVFDLEAFIVTLSILNSSLRIAKLKQVLLGSTSPSVWNVYAFDVSAMDWLLQPLAP